MLRAGQNFPSFCHYASIDYLSKMSQLDNTHETISLGQLKFLNLLTYSHCTCIVFLRKGRQGHGGAGWNQWRDHHPGSRRPCRPVPAVLQGRCSIRKVAGGAQDRRRRAVGAGGAAECAGVSPLRHYMSGEWAGAHRGAGGAHRRRPRHREVCRGHGDRPRRRLQGPQ